MRISVDTSNDSHDDIRKVIRMLQHFVGDQHISTNAPEDESESQDQAPTEPTAAFTSMFGGMDDSPLADDESQTDENTSPMAEPSSEELLSQAAQSADDSQSEEQSAEAGQVNADELFSDLFNQEDLEEREQPEDSDSSDSSSDQTQPDSKSDDDDDEDAADDKSSGIQIY